MGLGSIIPLFAEATIFRVEAVLGVMIGLGRSLGTLRAGGGDSVSRDGADFLEGAL